MLCCILSATASSTSFLTYVLTGGFPTNLSVGGSSISLFRWYMPPFDSHLRAITRGSPTMSAGSLMRCGNLVPRSDTSVNSPKCFRLYSWQFYDCFEQHIQHFSSSVNYKYFLTVNEDLGGGVFCTKTRKIFVSALLNSRSNRLYTLSFD